jgi:hypothetical protein
MTLGSISVGNRADFEAMNRAIAMYRLQPVFDRTFPFVEGKQERSSQLSRSGMQLRRGFNHAGWLHCALQL